MRFKALFIAVIALLAAGCSTTQSVMRLEGSGTKRIFNAPYNKVWNAAITASQSEGINIVKSDKNAGTISAKTNLRATSWGENIAVWVREISKDSTEVEVESRKAGPALFFHYNWEGPILENIEKQLK